MVNLFKNKYLYPLSQDVEELDDREGRYTMLRAQLMLKLFYLSIVDPDDKTGYQFDFETSRTHYFNKFKEI